jgi:hypothetical protein
MRWLYGLAAALRAQRFRLRQALRPGPTDRALFKTSDSARYHMLCAYFPKLGTHLSLVR